MVRITAGVIAGFIAWAILWFGSEKVLSAVWPAFGAHQAAFQSAIENGGEFIANTTMLLTHIAVGAIVSVISGILAALTAGENKRAPLILGTVLLGFGLLKAIMSWPYAPVWYHAAFTAMLLPLTVMGGKLKTS